MPIKISRTLWEYPNIYLKQAPQTLYLTSQTKHGNSIISERRKYKAQVVKVSRVSHPAAHTLILLGPGSSDHRLFLTFQHTKLINSKFGATLLTLFHPQ